MKDEWNWQRYDAGVGRIVNSLIKHVITEDVKISLTNIVRNELANGKLLQKRARDCIKIAYRHKILFVHKESTIYGDGSWLQTVQMN